MDAVSPNRLERLRHWVAVPLPERDDEWVREFEATFWPTFLIDTELLSYGGEGGRPYRSYRLYGTSFAPRFWNEPHDRGGWTIIQEVEEAKVGAPNEEMFPSIVRHAVRRTMKEGLGIREPRVLLIQRPGRGSRLVFGLDPDELGGPEATDLAFQKVAWCVPSCIPLYRWDSMVGSCAMQPF